MRGRVEGLEADAKNRLILAWQIASLVGFSKPPALEKLLRAVTPAAERARTPKMSTEQIESFFDRMVH